jgi:hypothetical protein
VNDNWDFLNANTRLESIKVGDILYRVGDRVRICPQANADIMDIVLSGKSAMIDGIEQDFEDRVYLALVLEDDPGKDLGHMRQPGHRFFYGPDEVELLGTDEDS